MRFGQAAMLAAILVLPINNARAEDVPAKDGCPDCCCKDGKCGKTVKTIKAECKCACAKDSKCCKDGSCCKSGKCCSKDGACCKDGKCACGSKDGKCACGSKDGKCACGSKDSKCCKDGSCCKSGKCCSKDGACCKGCQASACCGSKTCCQASACCGSKTCCQGACGCSCCSAVNKSAAKAPFMHPIIVVLPMPMGGPAMPVCAGCPAGCGTVSVPMPPPPGLTPPVMPPQTIAMPVPPPCYGACPTNGPMPCPVAATQVESSVDYLSILGMVTDLCCAHTHPPSLPSMCMLGLGMAEDLCSMMANNRTATEVGGAYLPQQPQYAPPVPPLPPTRPVAILPPPTPIDGPCPLACAPAPMMTCSAATSAPAALKVRIVAKPDSDQLEMNVDDACVTCKKMVVKVGESSLRLTRMDGRVRIRTEELRAKASCVRTDRKDRLVLEGDVELRLNKDGRSANVTAERIELNLTSGTITIQSMGRLQRVGVDFNQP
jgi:hypothetical protein